ncbi:3-hydroxyacyl-CoA dehydrogenase family protein, partial [Streptomyces sp. NPDC006872]|uniref:3-hydroxyacyl-CoA dehydrogenase family protein n=1 Tax=Streptomyces sp. NPDC006872 TaxID=3155720 RepID=UPI0033C161CA
KEPERTKRPDQRRARSIGPGIPSPKSMYEEYKEPLYAAPPLLQRMVDAGRLGRKTGSGFYTY